MNPTDKFYYCFGCGAKGDLITFVRETEQLDFAGAIEWLADRFNVQIEYEETSPQQDARRRRRERLLELLDAAASFYERYLWDSQAGSLARDYLAGRGLGEEVCREYRLGLALGGTTLTRKALERGFTREELVAAGLINRRGNDYFFAPAALSARRRARPRARLPGAQAARGRSAAREVRQLAGGRAVPQRRPALRARPCARRDREAGTRGRRRGEHRRARAAAGGHRAGRRVRWARHSPSGS